MLQHGLILNDPAMIPVNIVGLILNIVYLSVFYTYTKDKVLSCFLKLLFLSTT